MSKKSKSKAIFATGNTDMVSADYADELLGAAEADASAGGAYLKLTKAGDWIYGADETEIDGDDILAVNPASFVAGWQGWEDGVPVDGPVVSYAKRAGLPPKSDLEPIPAGDMNGWSQMVGCQMRLMDDETPLIFNTTSKGGKDFIRDLVKAVAMGIKAHPAEPVALIKLSSGSYKHKQYGKIVTPTFEVVGWADANGKQNKKLKAA